MKEDYTVNVFKALAHPIRIKIIKKLYSGEVCVCKINEDIDFSQANLSQHLKILKDARVVKAEKRGMFMYYSIKSEKVKLLLDLVEGMFEEDHEIY